ncbi:MAG: RagB/SusD family nutrient uptake outer membrane protein [Dysgonamonadaceae bacterium]|nr:RagB/SusD family nutrient uptake outer membrane protein [Dysgonamonadaceae bacterium]
MKKYIILFSALLIAGFTSCTDYLDKAPGSDIEPDDAYKNFKNFQGFTEELYNCIPVVSSHDSHSSFNFGDDDWWESTETRMLAYAIDQGNFWGWTAGFTFGFPKVSTASPNNQTKENKANLWALSWYGIRKANIGLANLDKLTDATSEERNLIEGQLIFFRGWFHFMLMQYWGGLPYIDYAIPADVTPTLPRLSWQEAADKAVSDFQRAAELLPVNWDETAVGKVTIGKNNLRTNKIMSLAYMGKTLLWAGSPLMNYASGGSKSYDADYCKRAADAFAQALQLTESTGRYELADFSQYSELIYTYNQSGKIPGLKETIFMENLVNYDNRWRWNMVNDFRPMNINASGIKCYPTANYVDFYGTKTGYPINDITQKDAEAGYDPEYPWKDRDPRFYTDILFDGVKCSENSAWDEAKQYASLYTGGQYRTYSGNAKDCLTGYMNKKLCPQLMHDGSAYQNNNVLVLSFMRLADVYLMYAEAAAVGYGTPQSKAGSYSLSAEDAVNKVRNRAGVGNVAAKFLDNTEHFMSEVRRERAVELAFEGHRFHDLRRWMLFIDPPYTLKKAIEFDRADAQMDYTNPQNAKVKNLRETVLFERKYTDRHYWFPLPKNDVNLYEGFGQNPGW